MKKPKPKRKPGKPRQTLAGAGSISSPTNVPTSASTPRKPIRTRPKLFQIAMTEEEYDLLKRVYQVAGHRSLAGWIMSVVLPVARGLEREGYEWLVVGSQAYKRDGNGDE